MLDQKGAKELIALLRPAQEEDADGIMACLNSAFREYRPLYTPSGFTDTTLSPETVIRRLTQMRVYVAVDEEHQIIGTVSWSRIKPEEGHLRGMAVSPEHQGSGLADRLLDRAETDIKEVGCRFVSLHTMDFLKRSIRFYKKRGYQRTGKTTDFFGQPAYEFVKELK
jgi:ribosomal protein S18 acetylase RimI-like enzyme